MVMCAWFGSANCCACFRGQWRGLFLASDVVLESVTYGGVINVGCHGAGKTQARQKYPQQCKKFS